MCLHSLYTKNYQTFLNTDDTEKITKYILRTYKIFYINRVFKLYFNISLRFYTLSRYIKLIMKVLIINNVFLIAAYKILINTINTTNAEDG